MKALAERLRSWAQNEEMVDSGYTAHGHDCNAAADLLDATHPKAPAPYPFYGTPPAKWSAPHDQAL